MFNVDRKIHPRRVLDITNGSAINGAKTTIQKMDLAKVLHTKDLDTELNKFLRANSPSIYAVDVDLIANEVIKAIRKNPQVYLKYILVDGVNIYFEDKEYQDNIRLVLYNLIKSRRSLASRLRDRLNKLPAVLFSDVQEVLNKEYSSLITQLTSIKSSASYKQGYRIPSAKVGAEFRRYLNSIGICKLSDAANAFTNIGSRIVIIAYRFDAVKPAVNGPLQEEVNLFLKELGLELSQIKKTSKSGKTTYSDALQVGNLVDAGHTGLFSSSNIPLGINMPSGSIAAIKTNSFKQIDSALLSTSAHIEHSLRVNTDYTNAGMLLDMQFNIAVSMRSMYNRDTVNRQEANAIANALQSMVVQELSVALKTQIKEGIIQDTTVIPSITNSPNILEFLTSTIVYSLQGKLAPKVKSSSITKKVEDVVLPKLKILVPKLLPTKRVVSSTITPTPYSIRTTSGQFYSLANLQILLNTHLQDVISANMGNGGERRVLNYRTGRFAASAKVERLSQSRAGAITAFYSYMRNPYEVFEPGHKMGTPLTRDPKVLIAKSIREIAATKVANTMRSVRV